MISAQAGLAAESPYADVIYSLSAAQQQTLADTIVQAKDKAWAEVMLSKVPNLTTAQHQAMVNTIVQANDVLLAGTALTKVSNLTSADRQAFLNVIVSSSNTPVMEGVLIQSTNLSQADGDALVQAIVRNKGTLAAQAVLSQDKNLTANQRTVLQSIDPNVPALGGATVNGGTQTVPNDSYPTQPAGTITVSGTASSASSVSLVIVKSTYAGAQDYMSVYKNEVTETAVPLKVSNGVWSATMDLGAGSYTVLVYDGSSYKLIGSGTVTVVIH